MSLVELDPREDMKELHPQPVDDLLPFRLGGKPEQCTKMGTKMPMKVHKQIENLLK